MASSPSRDGYGGAADVPKSPEQASRTILRFLETTAELESRLEAANRRLDSEKRVRTALDAALEDERRQRLRGEQALAEEQARSRSLAAALEEATGERKIAEQRLASDASGERALRENMQSALALERSEVQRLTLELKAERQNSAALRTQAHELEVAVAEQTRVHVELRESQARLETGMDKYTAQIATLRAENATLRQAEMEREVRAAADEERRQNDLAALQRDVDDLSGLLRSERRKSSVLQNSINSERAARAFEASYQANTLEAKVEELAADLRARDGAVDAHKRRIAALVADNTALAAENDALRKHNRRLEETTAEQEVRLQSLRRHVRLTADKIVIGGGD